MMMCEAQTICNETGRQGERSVWASHRSPAGFISGETEMKLIPLTQGKFAIVDDEDFEWLNQYKWCAHWDKYNWYAQRRKGRKIVLMHKEILNVPEGFEPDHINRNGLDNQRHNLRICTHAENCRNRKLNHNNKSGFRGVCWDRKSKKWRASIKYCFKTFCLGFFNSEIEAARAYDCKAKELFGEFAYLKFPDWRAAAIPE